MSWVEKKYHSNLDNLPISGLFYLDGDIFVRLLALQDGNVNIPFFNPEWLKHQKMPQIAFPSGEEFDIGESRDPQNGGIVHVYGEMGLPYFDTRDSAWKRANAIAKQVGYLAQKRGENQLEVIGHGVDEHFLITYDNEQRFMLNIERVALKRGEEHPRQPLLDDELRQKLPPLRSQEHLVFEAQVQVKFFTPDSHWTWYATEASYFLKRGGTASLQELSPDDPDIEDVIFFGLVSGDDLEFGSFSLSELESTRGGLGLPVERDRHFTPTTLGKLHALHEHGE